MHANNFAFLMNNPCQKNFIENHYNNMQRDIKKLTVDKQKRLKSDFIKFLNEGFDKIIIK
jgi:hypothetical protein